MLRSRAHSHVLYCFPHLSFSFLSLSLNLPPYPVLSFSRAAFAALPSVARAALLPCKELRKYFHAMSFAAPALPLLETLPRASPPPAQLEATVPAAKSASDEDGAPSGLFVTGGGGGTSTCTESTGGVRWAPGLMT